MSDGDSTLTPSAESSPQGTAEIAANVIESYEPTPEPSGDGLETPTPETPIAAAETPGVVKPPLSEEEKLLEEFGFKEATHPDGRDFRIPRSKVLKMIASGLKRGQERWTAERTPLETELSGYKERFSSVQPILEMLDQGPEAFLAEAAKHDPKFKAYLESRATVAQPAPEIGFPEPDLDLGNGAKTYSIEGIKKLVQHATHVARAEAKREAEAALKPLTEREKAAQEREQQTKAEQAVQERTRASMKEAESWPHFGKLADDGTLTEFQNAVLKELQADTEQAKAEKRAPRLSFEGAYIRCASKLIAEDDTTRRAKLLKEVSAAAKASPSVPRSGGEVPSVPSGVRSTADIAARALERLEAGS